MEADLEAFLTCCSKASEEIVSWAGGAMRLQLTSYLAEDIPPLEYVTSARAIVLQGDTVLVVRYPDSLSILPGGRREEGEEIEGTLRRELMEETGWEVGNIRLLGFQHYHHLTGKPAGYRYPYPNFLQLIYVVLASQCISEVRQENGTDLECWFCPITEANELHLSPGEQAFLGEAYRSR